MRRGTTPTHVFEVNIDLTQAVAIYITYRQNATTVMEKSIDDISVTAEQIEVTLTQEDTLKFKRGDIQIQIRAKMPDGMAYASEIINTSVEAILKDGVI